MKKFVAIFILTSVVTAIFTLVACKSVAKPVPNTALSQSLIEDREAKEPQKAIWQAQWEALLKEGKKEGKLVIYTTQTSNEMRQAIVKVMQEKYGIQLDILVARGAEITARILAERNAKLFMVDVYLGGPTDPLNKLKPAGFLEPLEPLLILPEVTDPKYWFEGKLGWLDKDRYIIGFLGSPNAPLAINTAYVKAQEIASYYDLLNPKWKGRIIMNDPTTPGTGSSSFRVLAWNILNLDFFHQLAKQEPVVMRDRRLLVEWTARGKYAICLFPNTSIVKEFRDAGASLTLLTPREGTYLSSGGGDLAVLKQAPHPDAAKIFTNWILSREGQTIVSRAKGNQSLRIDVKTEGLDLTEVRQEGIKYFEGADSEEFLAQEPERTRIAEEIFGPFIVK